MKKRLMKAVAMLLSAVMIFGILPTALAAEATDIKIVYSIENCEMEDAADLTNVSFDKNKGFWEYEGKENISKIYKSKTNGLQSWASKAGAWWALRLNVPASGTYEVKLTYTKASNAGKAYLYFGDGAKSASEILSTASIGNYTFTASATAKNQDSGVIGTVTADKPGEYIMVFRFPTTEEGYASGTNRHYIKEVILQGSADASAGVIGTVTTSAGNTIPMGETVTASIVAYDTVTGATVDNSGVTYTSGNTSVISVTEDGKLRANKIGSASVTAFKAGWANAITSTIDVVPSMPYSAVELVYSTEIGTTGGASLEDTEFSDTNGFWSFEGKLNANLKRDLNNGAQAVTAKFGSWWALRLNVPVSGTYDIKLNRTVGKDGDKAFIYFGKADKGIDAIISQGNVCDTTFLAPSTSRGMTDVLGSVSVEDAGEYIMLFRFPTETEGYNTAYSNRKQYVKQIILDGGDGEALIGTVDGVADELEAGATATATASAFLSKTGSVADSITFESSDSSILEVSADGTVKAVSEGNADIIVKSANALGEIRKSVKVNAPAPKEPGEEVSDTLVNFTFVASDAMAGSVSAAGYPAVGEVAIGTSVAATAVANDGYEFAYWRNGAGTVLSTEKTETFKFNTNTAVYAEFIKLADETTTEAPLYFYNGNGALLDSKSVEKGTTFSKTKIANPSLTGYVFAGWSVDDDTVISSLTRAVALYAESDKEYTVTADGAVVTKSAIYGSKVTVTSDKADFKAWKLGDKIVSYNKTFTFYAWGDVALISVTEGESAPVAVLTSVDGKPMLIYNTTENCEIIEAGILFGNGATISSYDSKAFAKEMTGQFIAEPNGRENNSTARGYLIFKKNGAIRVIYAD